MGQLCSTKPLIGFDSFRLAAALSLNCLCQIDQNWVIALPGFRFLEKEKRGNRRPKIFCQISQVKVAHIIEVYISLVKSRHTVILKCKKRPEIQSISGKPRSQEEKDDEFKETNSGL